MVTVIVVIKCTRTAWSDQGPCFAQIPLLFGAANHAVWTSLTHACWQTVDWVEWVRAAVCFEQRTPSHPRTQRLNSLSPKHEQRWILLQPPKPKGSIMRFLGLLDLLHRDQFSPNATRSDAVTKSNHHPCNSAIHWACWSTNCATFSPIGLDFPSVSLRVNAATHPRVFNG